jgi:hypothetical protein
MIPMINVFIYNKMYVGVTLPIVKKIIGDSFNLFFGIFFFFVINEYY